MIEIKSNKQIETFTQTELDVYIDANVLPFEEMVDEWARLEYTSVGQRRGVMTVRQSGEDERRLTYSTVVDGTWDVAKTKSATDDLEYGLLKYRKGFISTILNRDSGRLWQEFSNGIPNWRGLIISKDPTIRHIPISPVYKLRGKSEEDVRVLTRYTGLSVRYLDHKMTKIRQTPSEIGTPVADKFQLQLKVARMEMNEQMRKIKSKLKLYGINMGHDHPGNFTVEFIKEEYYDQMLGEDGESNINDIPYDADNFSFSLRDYLKGGYKMVVRAIDLDVLGVSPVWLGEEIRKEFTHTELAKHSSRIVELLGEESAYKQMVGLIAAECRMGGEDEAAEAFQVEVVRKLPSLLSPNNIRAVRLQAAGLLDQGVLPHEVAEQISGFSDDEDVVVRRAVKRALGLAEEE